MKNATTRYGEYFLFLLMFIFPALANGQESKYLSGKVTDEITGKPISGCSVYFSNTSKGDVSNAAGEFTIKKLPEGKYELVVSAIGYETKTIQVSSDNYPHMLEIELARHSAEMTEVVVQPSLINGWQKWGQTFRDNFIGTTANANACYIKNQDVLKFWYSEKNNRLTVRAEEPLIIENNALGYIIKFKLEEFVLDFNSGIMLYNGYPLFQEIDNEKKQSKWIENRKEAYYGSVLEFMRCVYNDTWKSSGYRIVLYTKRPNLEKKRVQRIVDSAMARQSNKNEMPGTIISAGKDSTGYFKKVLKQPDSLQEYVELPNLDTLLITEDENTKSLFFSEKMKIVYQRYPQSKPIQSEVYLRTPQAINIQENGSYFSTKEFVNTMHWAQYEKVANMLPFDYEP